MQVYLKAKSKKAINEWLAANPGCDVVATEYNDMHTTTIHPIRRLPHGAIVKIYTKRVDGNPVAKSYGTWDANNQRVK